MYLKSPKCHLIIDSCCDLPPNVIDIGDIEILNFPFLLDEEDLEDDFFQTISEHDFYEKLRKGADCSTAQIRYMQLQETFDQAAESGIPTVYLGFSSGLSGNFETVQRMSAQACETHPDAEIYVVDTKLASIAEGVLVYEAIRQLNRGLSACELVTWAEEIRYFVNNQFLIDDLAWLKKGGRIPSAVALAGNMLNVKPIFEVSLDGTLATAGVSRGRKKGIRHLADYYEKQSQDDSNTRYVIIGGADCPKDLDRLEAELHKIDEKLLVIRTAIGPVIGSHVGPGMVALSFIGKDRRENISTSDRIARKIVNADVENDDVLENCEE